MKLKVTQVQKGVIVNRILLFITLVFSINECTSQTKIEGKYYVEDVPKWVITGGGGDFTYFEFKKTGDFEKKTNGEFGVIDYGKGEFKILNKKLILDYNKTDPLQTAYNLSRIWSNNKDSISVNLKFFDFENTPIPYVNVIYKDSLSKNDYSGIIANEKGVAVFNLKRDKTNLHLIITNLGFKQYDIFIEKSYNYDISVFLQKAYTGVPILNQTDTLDIVKIKRKYLIVKNKNGSETKWKKIAGE